MAEKTERKLGDLTSDALRAARLDRLATAYTAVTGKPCNCANNKKALNNIHDKLREAMINGKGRKNG